MDIFLLVFILIVKFRAYEDRVGNYDFMLAPIALFVYNRPDHTKKTLEALQSNFLAKESILIVYCDGPKKDASKSNLEKIHSVRETVKSANWCKETIVIEQDENQGLASSIITGVSDVVNRHGSVIVLEDDLVTSPYFLTFMNQALDRFKAHPSIWHISGWNYPIDVTTDLQGFLWKVMNCWGWATWKDRWDHFRNDSEYFMKRFHSRQSMLEFDFAGTGEFWDQLLYNHTGRSKTWAIFWHATINDNNGYCLNPLKSYVNNIGQDNTGQHAFDRSQLYHKNLATVKFDFNAIDKEPNDIMNALRKYIRKRRSIYRRMLFIWQLIKPK